MKFDSCTKMRCQLANESCSAYESYELAVIPQFQFKIVFAESRENHRRKREVKKTILAGNFF